MTLVLEEGKVAKCPSSMSAEVNAVKEAKVSDACNYSGMQGPFVLKLPSVLFSFSHIGSV